MARLIRASADKTVPIEHVPDVPLVLSDQPRNLGLRETGQEQGDNTLLSLSAPLLPHSNACFTKYLHN